MKIDSQQKLNIRFLIQTRLGSSGRRCRRRCCSLAALLVLVPEDVDGEVVWNRFPGVVGTAPLLVLALPASLLLLGDLKWNEDAFTKTISVKGLN